MKKLLKSLSILVVVAICAICMTALFTACNKEELATDTIYITVLDENGKAINGTTFGKGDYNPDYHQVQIQFCTLDGGCTVVTPNVGADGKAQFDLAVLKEFAKANNADTVELHVLNVTAVGYEKGESGEYGRFKIDKVPKNIEVTLKKA